MGQVEPGTEVKVHLQKSVSGVQKSEFKVQTQEVFFLKRYTTVFKSLKHLVVVIGVQVGYAGGGSRDAYSRGLGFATSILQI